MDLRQQASRSASLWSDLRSLGGAWAEGLCFGSNAPRRPFGPSVRPGLRSLCSLFDAASLRPGLPTASLRSFGDFCVSRLRFGRVSPFRLRFGDLRQQASIRPRFTGSTLVAPMSSTDYVFELLRGNGGDPWAFASAPLRACGLRISLSALRFDSGFPVRVSHSTSGARSASAPRRDTTSAENIPHRVRNTSTTLAARRKTAQSFFGRGQKRALPLYFFCRPHCGAVADFSRAARTARNASKTNRTTA